MYKLVFDIGSKNLAYCLTRTTGNDLANLEILLWNLVDIRVIELKCCMRKKRSVCNEKAIFYENLDGGVCSEHYKTLTKEEKRKLLRVSKNTKLINNFSNIVDNLLEFLNSLYILLQQPFYLNNTLQKCQNIDVYIENQLALSNPKAKSISVVVLTFFKLLQNTEIVQNVGFISASLKTKQSFLTRYLDVSEIPDLTKTKDKKNIIVILVNKIIKKIPSSLYSTPNQIKYLTNFTKKDDLADTLAYAIYLGHT